MASSSSSRLFARVPNYHFDDLDAQVAAILHRADAQHDAVPWRGVAWRRAGDAEPLWDANRAGVFYADGRHWALVRRDERRRSASERTTSWAEVTGRALPGCTSSPSSSPTERTFACYHIRHFVVGAFPLAPAFPYTAARTVPEALLADAPAADRNAFLLRGDVAVLHPFGRMRGPAPPCACARAARR